VIHFLTLPRHARNQRPKDSAQGGGKGRRERMPRGCLGCGLASPLKGKEGRTALIRSHRYQRKPIHEGTFSWARGKKKKRSLSTFPIQRGREKDGFVAAFSRSRQTKPKDLVLGKKKRGKKGKKGGNAFFVMRQREKGEKQTFDTRSLRKEGSDRGEGRRKGKERGKGPSLSHNLGRENKGKKRSCFSSLLSLFRRGECGSPTKQKGRCADERREEKNARSSTLFARCAKKTKKKESLHSPHLVQPWRTTASGRGRTFSGRGREKGEGNLTHFPSSLLIVRKEKRRGILHRLKLALVFEERGDRMEGETHPAGSL